MKQLRAFVLPLALLALWQLADMMREGTSDTFAAPIEIAGSFVTAFGTADLWRATGDTLASAALGFAIGFALGVTAGIAFALLPPLGRLLRLTVEVLRPLPAIAIVPVAILALGFGYKLEVTIVAFATFFPVLIMAEAAVRQINPQLTEVATVLNLSALAKLWKIIIPAAMPRFFVAARLSTGIALIVAITVEVAANPMGLGARLMSASQSLRPADMFATLVWIGILGWGLNLLLVACEQKLFSNGRGIQR